MLLLSKALPLIMLLFCSSWHQETATSSALDDILIFVAMLSLPLSDFEYMHPVLSEVISFPVALSCRPITDGEIGCFLSHYKIWKDVVDRQLGAVMVIEDDAKFEPGFVRRLTSTLDEIEKLSLAWDLM